MCQNRTFLDGKSCLCKWRNLFSAFSTNYQIGPFLPPFYLIGQYERWAHLACPSACTLSLLWAQASRKLMFIMGEWYRPLLLISSSPLFLVFQLCFLPHFYQGLFLVFRPSFILCSYDILQSTNIDFMFWSKK